MNRTNIVLGVGIAFGYATTACGAEPPSIDAGGKNPRIAMSSIVSSGDDSVSYVTLLDSLEPQTVDYKNSIEFPGQADLWMHDGFLYVAESESLTVKKYSLSGRELVPEGELNFSQNGFAFLGFWSNAFVSPTKAYFINDNLEYVVWDPAAMSITKTVALPELGPKGALAPVAGYSDRAAIVRDGFLYQTIYWSDDDYFSYAPSSAILVVDIDTDEVVKVIDAPCPGLDYGTKDADGNLYFSSWIYAPGGAALLDQPATCVAKLAPGEDEATMAFRIGDVTGGREGGAYRIVGDGKAMLSVLHPEHASADERGDVEMVTFGGNWRFWSYDTRSGAADEIQAIDWNAGAVYPVQAAGRSYSLVPTDQYESTTLYDVTAPAAPVEIFNSKGWTLRLVDLR